MKKSRHGEVLSCTIKYDDGDKETNKDLAEILPQTSAIGKYLFHVDENKANEEEQRKQEATGQPLLSEAEVKNHICRIQGCTEIGSAQCSKCGNKVFCSMHHLHGAHVNKNLNRTPRRIDVKGSAAKNTTTTLSPPRKTVVDLLSDTSSEVEKPMKNRKTEPSLSEHNKRKRTDPRTEGDEEDTNEQVEKKKRKTSSESVTEALLKHREETPTLVKALNRATIPVVSGPTGGSGHWNHFGKYSTTGLAVTKDPDDLGKNGPKDLKDYAVCFRCYAARGRVTLSIKKPGCLVFVKASLQRKRQNV